MEDYDELVQQCQNGEIDMLQFLLGQKELANAFWAEMKEKGSIPTPESAEKWLIEYEKNII
ncbi:hypothetical protein CLI85_12930 [Tannerella forsythia]|nr:hypothetical protein CLI85_12930 [Tannerella forsythia]